MRMLKVEGRQDRQDVTQDLGFPSFVAYWNRPSQVERRAEIADRRSPSDRVCLPALPVIIIKDIRSETIIKLFAAWYVYRAQTSD